MLQAINDKAKGLIGGIIILFISIPFALWGIQEYIGGAEKPFAAKVNDVEISLAKYEEALARHRQRMRSIFGDKLPSDADFEKRMRQQVIDQLITRQLLEQMAASAGYRISDQVLAQKIHALEAFQENGQFVAATYKNVLSSQGMSVAEFEHMYRQDLVVQQLQDGISKTAVVDNGSLGQLDRLQQQKRKVDYLLFKQTGYLPDIQPTDEEIALYYEENKDRYRHPEKVSVSYVELKGSDLLVDTPVDEESLRRQYDAYVASLAANEMRKARHILIKVKENADDKVRVGKKQQLQDILKKIKSGESFEKLAKEFSEDPGSAGKGGNLDWVSKGMMVPAFEEALYKLKPGEVSDIITTGFGYHVIKLEDIKSEKPVSFEDKKAELTNAVRQEEVDNLFYEHAEEMATLAYENDQTLEPIIESLAATAIEKSLMFTRTSGQGIAQHEAVRSAAFSEAVLKEGRNSDVIELGKNHVVVIRLDQHQPSKPKTLEEVKAQVTVTVKSMQARQKAQADALQALAKLQQGASMSELASDKHAEYKDLGSIKRDFSAADRRIVDRAFQMQKPEAGQTAYDSIELTTDAAVIAVADVKMPDAEPKAEDLKALQAQMLPMLANRELNAVIEYLKEKSDIVMGKDLF